MTDTPAHIPVLAKEVMQAFSQVAHKPTRFLDGTFGRGGHTALVLQAYPQIEVVAVDQDHEAIEYGKIKFEKERQEKKIFFIHQNFAEVPNLKAQGSPELQGDFDLILLDLGVSSPQLDSVERGFSFYGDGPLDMRMDQRMSQSAAEIVNEWSQDELLKLFKEYGEIPNPFRVVRALVHDRDAKPFTRTSQLSSLIERIDGWKKKGHHPATRYFMALRMAVNQELEVVESILEPMIQMLAPGGRLAVITFHSLEDRIVKHRFKELLNYGTLVNKKVIKPEYQETLDNPRSRSAKLRVFQKSN